MTDIEAGAQTLVQLRRAAAFADRLPVGVAPVSLADAYRMQDRFCAIWAQPVVAWKAGATAAAVQARFGLSAPFAGPVFAADHHLSPARLAAARFPHLAIESEFAFRFARTLAPKPTGYSRADVLAHVDALVPAIEIVGPRFGSFLFDSAYTAIADCGLNAALITGAAMTTFDPGALAAHAVRLRVDGTVRAEGIGANVLGDPVNALVWAANHLCERGITLQAGQLVSTGTTTGIVHVEPEQDVSADFGPFGEVSVRFTAPAHPRMVRPA